MTRLHHLLWAAAGCPDPLRVIEAASGPCHLCGGPLAGRGVALGRALPPTFSDRDQAAAPTSTHLCCACCWALAGRPPASWRTWSVVFRTDRPPGPSSAGAPAVPHAQVLSLRDAPALLDPLLVPPAGTWGASVTTTGKVHHLPFAPVTGGTPGQWEIQVDRAPVRSTPAQIGGVVHHAVALLAAGASREDLRSATPSPTTVARVGVPRWRRHAAALAPFRTSPLLGLALFLIRKESYDVLRSSTPPL